MKIEEKAGKFIISSFNALDAYKIASRVEKDGITFYQKLLNKVKDSKTKEVLKLLLKEEDKHLKFFKDCLYEIKETSKDDFEEDDLLGSMDFGIFWPYQNIKDLESKLSDNRKAFKLGIAIEDKSINFYQACRDNIATEEIRLELDNIIEEEKKHKALLESLLGGVK
ncbi:MAG: ferritin family protein [Candidatus Omnitrophica bacterium]|jgi:rubrerythrin|nr:ferritin family protein [Candidatus Omnitrophota bacterium]